MKNNEIRNQATTLGVKLWQIADRLGITDGNFSRKLRKELPDKEKIYIIQIINEISKEAN